MRWVIVALVLAVSALPASAQTAPILVGERMLCSALDEIAEAANAARAAEAARVRSMACQLPVDDIDPGWAEALLTDRPLQFERARDVLTVVARSERDEVWLCCSLHTQMTRLGNSNYFAARFRLAELDRALLYFIPTDRVGRRVPDSDKVVYRGPDAPSAPALMLNGALEGQVVETTLWSTELDETRKLVIYLPPGHAADAEYAALVVADGDSVHYYARMIEPMIAAEEIAPLVLIGIPSGQDGIVEDRSALNLDLRAADYLPAFEGAGDRFDRHMRFVTDTLLPFAEREYGVTQDRARRGVDGFSNGAVFAYWAGVLRPDLFGVALVRSSGYRGDANVEQLENPMRARFLMSAGMYETRFWVSTQRRAEALRAAGYDVTFRSLAAGHAPDQGNIAFADFVRMAFPPRREG